MDDMDWWVWLIIALAVIALIALIAYAMRNRASARAIAHKRERAGELREQAEAGSVEASKREAEAAAARAEAEQQRIAAEQLERKAQHHEREAGEVRADAGERLAEADRVDPDVDHEGLGQHADRSAADERMHDDTRTDVPRDDATGEATDVATGEHVRDVRRDVP